MKLLRISNLLILCLCLVGIAHGQETTGVIEGTVIDAQGARVAGFNQPLTRQIPRQVRFGFRFVF